VSRKKILVFIDWYLPGYKAGGPIQSVANMIEHLKDEFDFAVVTSDTDLHEKEPYKNITSNKWTTAPDGTRTYYFSQGALTSKALKELIYAERADYIYLNSLFSLKFTLLPLYIRKKYLPTRKVVLAPRGMLGQGALNIKPGKKKTFLFASRLIGLYKDINWHASTHLEESEIKGVFGKKTKVITAVNLTAHRTPHFQQKVKKENECRLVFISRIASKKNILPVLFALYKLPSEIKVTFDIYGPIDDAAYWQQCEEVIRSAPSNIQISYRGAIENAQVQQTLSTYHFSVLYTQHENFGHSIVESMAAGCPVIISDQTPWRNLAAKKCGWDVPITDENKLFEVLKQACIISQGEYDEWSHSALTFASGVINDKNAIEANRSLFR